MENITEEERGRINITTTVTPLLKQLARDKNIKISDALACGIQTLASGINWESKYWEEKDRNSKLGNRLTDINNERFKLQEEITEIKDKLQQRGVKID